MGDEKVGPAGLGSQKTYQRGSCSSAARDGRCVAYTS